MQGANFYEKNVEKSAEQIVSEYLPLVKKIAVFIKRKLPSSIEFDDLLQSGLVGLLEAGKNYNPDLGASFETFASIRIRGAIIDSLRKNSWVSRETIKNMKRISQAISRIEQRDQRPATTEAIIKELEITADELFKISQEINMLQIVSLNEETMNVAHEDLIDPEKIAQKEWLKESLKNCLKLLPEREQLVLSLYYVEELTFKQIGEALDLTEARICQLHSQAIIRIRSKLKYE